ncbi:Nn.00g063770.m01.CDS01 [Neocucurbitaria sp. VM-36]
MAVSTVVNMVLGNVTHHMQSPSPLPTAELEQIASSACEQAIGAAEAYDHSKVADWNTAIIPTVAQRTRPIPSSPHPPSTPRPPPYLLLLLPIHSKPPTTLRTNHPSLQQTILKSLISKTSSTSPIKTEEPSSSTSEAGQPAYKYIANSTVIQHIGSPSEPERHGRRGMHSAVGAFWNNEKDGTYSYKWEAAEKKGMDIVITITWIAI